MLQSMGLQKVRHDIVTKQQQSFDVQLLGLLSEKKKKKTLLYTLAPPFTSSKQSLRTL